MEFKYDIDSLNRLSKVTASKDIKSISNVFFPGSHCPLFGAAMISSQVKDLEVIVVGTDECTYYTQAFVIDRLSSNNNYWSYSMQQNDIVFGSFEKVCEAIEYVYKLKTPKAMMIISTCVPEIIGDDFDSIAVKMKEELNIPILVARTEHFTCNNHIAGIEKTLESFVELMEPREKVEKRINILGHRFGELESSEIYKLLTKYGYEFNLTLPSKTNVETIKEAATASVNLVVDFTALGLAKEMKEKFDIPYVVFDKCIKPERIYKSYENLQEVLGVDLRKELEGLKEELNETIELAKKALQGKSFIYGNSPMNAFEVSSYLAEIGLNPLIIQARDIYENDHIFINEILEMGHDPHVSNIANISAMQHVYPIVKPNIYIGHENPMNIMKNNIQQALFDRSASSLGLELPICILKTLIETVSEDKISKMGKIMGSMDMEKMKKGHPGGGR